MTIKTTEPTTEELIDALVESDVNNLAENLCVIYETYRKRGSTLPPEQRQKKTEELINTLVEDIRRTLIWINNLQKEAK